jgi:hypothetical protein
MGGARREGIFERRIAYEPLPSQKAFHRLRERFKGFSGPIGSGKSQALCHEALKLAYLNPGCLGLIGAPTYPMLRDATQVALLEILNQNGIPYELNKAENILILAEAGSKILFRAVEDFERLRGTNLAWFGVDELTYTSLESWLRLEGRLRDPKAARLEGFGVWTPKGFDWVYERFIGKPCAGYGAVQAKPHENRHVLDRVPDFYERLKSSYDAAFYRQEVLGEYLEVKGDRVYGSFDRQKHVRNGKVNMWDPLLWAMDFNVNPMCAVVCQMQGDVLQVLDEIVLERASTRMACEEFWRRYPEHPGGYVVYADATGQRMQTSGTSDKAVVEQFLREWMGERYRLKIPASNPTVRDRVMLVNAMFESAGGKVRLYVSERCVELRKDLEQVGYKPNSCEIDKDRDPRRTHLSDALGYLVWQECRPQPPAPGERNFSLGIF